MTNLQTQLQLQLKDEQVNPIYADACGNTFYIFDCLHYSFTYLEWENFKRKIWAFLIKARVDDALVLRKVGKNKQTILLQMHVLEPDGTEADFCGNGARAVGFYLHRKYGEQKFRLVSRFGTHGFIFEKGSCIVEMGNPIVSAEKLTLGVHTFTFVDCIEPHLVTSDFFDTAVLTELGHRINQEWKEKFPFGVNVNCFRQLSQNTLEVLTFERGGYAITAACGTGSVSCTKVAIGLPADITIQVPGGQLYITQFNDIFWLGGSVVLEGKRSRGIGMLRNFPS